MGLEAQLAAADPEDLAEVRRVREEMDSLAVPDELLALSTVLVSPTSASAPPRSFRPAKELSGQQTRVLVEQTTAVARERLRDPVGRLDAHELRALDAALDAVFGL